MSKPLLVLGTTPFCIEVADVARDAGHEVAGFVEMFAGDGRPERVDGLPVMRVADILAEPAAYAVVCGAGSARKVETTGVLEAAGVDFATIVHPTARVSRRGSVGAGTTVSVGAIVATEAALGRHVLLNRASTVGHHTVIGDHVAIQTGAHVAGSCSVGAGVFVGMGALVTDHVNVGAGAKVGAGAVVLEDVPPAVLVVGVPARVVRELDGR